MASKTESYEGGCTCRHVRYRVISKPMFVHCCHCRWCQRETGTAFALNAMIEADRVEMLGGEVEIIDTPSHSGKGQKYSRCPKCRIALWSTYAGPGDAVRFIRVGTLDEPDRLPPDIHIFTMSKQPWVVLPAGTPAMPEFYDRQKMWPPESLQRRAAALRR
ncbi:MAG: aldehyde-activating protein [Alphaproteobacteria bacterium]|nr:aldehyde-activating protein [Alphaproteobacteria bacterium]